MFDSLKLEFLLFNSGVIYVICDDVLFDVSVCLEDLFIDDEKN